MKTMKKLPTKKQIQDIDLTVLNDYVAHSTHRSYFLDKEGQEHYKLLAAISNNAPKDSILIDLGTYKGLSALALSYNPDVQVYTYDINSQNTYKNILEKDNITFKNMSCFADLDFIKDAYFIFLDIDPHDGNQEHRFLQAIDKAGYKGYIICDDIHLNDKMENMWNEIEYIKEDITNIGHFSGSGLIKI